MVFNFSVLVTVLPWKNKQTNKQEQAEMKTSVEFEVWIFLFLLYYFSFVILLIFSCSPMEKGNEMLTCYEGMEAGGVLWMLCVNYLRHCMWKFCVLCWTRITFCHSTITLCMLNYFVRDAWLISSMKWHWHLQLALY